MADTTRRSGRATKGQHRGHEEVEPAPAPKKGGRGRKKLEPEPEEEEPEDAIIRCICGATTEEGEDERKMICCEQCEAWQHNECMEVSENDDELPEKYYCEQCRPADHKNLLKKIKKGEKPWEERQKAREQEEEDRRAKKGKSKRGRKPKASLAPQDDGETNGAAGQEGDTTMSEIDAQAAVPAPSEEVPQSPQATGNKRKLEALIPAASDSPQAEPASKLRKASEPLTSPKPTAAPPNRRKSSNQAGAKRGSSVGTLQTELVERVEDLRNSNRQRVAANLGKEFEQSVLQAGKDGTFSLPDGQSESEYGIKLALSVEYAMYLNFWGTDGLPPESYTDKFRGIKFNIKANTALRDRLLTGALSPNDLSKMSRDDMASKELQAKKAEMIKEAEKQHTLIQEEGPRIRRTHKGEELVDQDAHMAEIPENTFTAPIRNRTSDSNDTAVKESTPDDMAVAQSPEHIEVPERLSESRAEDKKPLKVDTQAHAAEKAATERKSSSTFNIEDVWSGVKPSDPDQSLRRQSRPIEPPTPALKQHDAELDRLLKDEDQDEEDEYEPTDSATDPNAPVWHGNVTMPNIAAFTGSGRHSAGSHNSSKIPWRQLLPSNLTIEGRIPPAKADEYLCGLQYSNSSDLTIVSVTPNSSDQDRAAFDKLFKYFTERDRYGVITRAPTSSVKDAYVTPLEAGTEKKPEFIELLDDCRIEFPVKERMLLCSFVVKMSNSPIAPQQTPHPSEAAAIHSPLTAGGHQPPLVGTHPGFQNSPTPGLPYPPPPQQQQYSSYGASPAPGQPYAPPPHYPAQQQMAPYDGVVGIEAARQALGDLVTAPVVSQLLEEAPNSGVPEWKVVRELMENVPACRTNYPLLKGMLTQRLQQQQHNGPQ